MTRMDFDMRTPEKWMDNGLYRSNVLEGNQAVHKKRPQITETVDWYINKQLRSLYLFLDFGGPVKDLFRNSQYYMKLVRKVEKLLYLLFL